MSAHDDHFHPDPDHTPDDHFRGPELEGPLETHPLWTRDNVVLTSVCIDVGSAGTQVLFSTMRLRRQAVDLSTRYLVVARETLYESPVALTPYHDAHSIDARALGALVDEAYHAAGVAPAEIDTGVVILTGEALARDNAEPIARVLSETCGNLVCAAAGHHMEALLAAHGSGAVALAHARDERLLDIDIGGGTTKLSVIDRGRVLATAAIHIGARLVAFDEAGTITRLEPAGKAHAAEAGFDWALGDTASAEALDAVAESMADDLVAALTARPPCERVLGLYLTAPITALEGLDGVVVSGGVAEFVYGRESREFGDLGRRLGAALARRFASGALPWRLCAESRGIRSTALGGSEFTAQLSGNTGYISDPAALLPRRNLEVLRPELTLGGDIDAAVVADAIARRLALADRAGDDADLVLALHWQGPPQFKRLAALAAGIRTALAERIARGRPVYVILDADVALNLGALLAEKLRREDGTLACELLVIDGLTLWDFDFIDLGAVREPSNTVPVTIKSLVFRDAPGGPQRAEPIGQRSHAVPLTSEEATSHD